MATHSYATWLTWLTWLFGLSSPAADQRPASALREAPPNSDDNGCWYYACGGCCAGTYRAGCDTWSACWCVSCGTPDTGNYYWSECSQTGCTNKPANSYYTGNGGSSNSSPWACSLGYTWSGSACVWNCPAGQEGILCSYCVPGSYKPTTDSAACTAISCSLGAYRSTSQGCTTVACACTNCGAGTSCVDSHSPNQSHKAAFIHDIRVAPLPCPGQHFSAA